MEEPNNGRPPDQGSTLIRPSTFADQNEASNPSNNQPSQQPIQPMVMEHNIVPAPNQSWFDLTSIKGASQDEKEISIGAGRTSRSSSVASSSTQASKRQLEADSDEQEWQSKRPAPPSRKQSKAKANVTSTEAPSSERRTQPSTSDTQSPPMKNRTKKKKKIISSLAINSPLALTNRFSVLHKLKQNNEEALLSQQQQLQQQQHKQKSPVTAAVRARAPPPITVLDAQYETVKTALADCAIKFDWKFAPNAIRILTASEPERIALIDVLKSKGIYNYSHPPRAAPRLRTILRGMPPGNHTAEIEAELTELGHKPVEIRFIRTLRGWPLYAVDFATTELTLEFLNNQINRIMSHVVSWEVPKDRPRPPSMCTNCCSYGHGEAWCGIPAVCSRCSLGHSLAECTLNERMTKYEEEFVAKINYEEGATPLGCRAYDPEAPNIRCVNCLAANYPPIATLHEATDPGCHVRYQKTKSMLAKRAKAAAAKAAEQQPPPMVPLQQSTWVDKRKNLNKSQSTTAFPNVRAVYGGNPWSPANQLGPPNGRTNQPSRPNRANRQQEEWPKIAQQSGGRRGPPNQAPLLSDMLAGQDMNDGQLWGPDQLAQLVMGAINEFSGCRSKAEQLAIILNLAAKCQRH